MIIQISQPRLRGYRFPRSIISYAVWAYHRFALSLRDVEDLLAERGIVVSYETIRAWVGKFGAQIAKHVRTARRQPTDKWHLDEVVITIRGKKHWLWRAVDSNGETLNILMQTRRNARAAKRFISRLIARWGTPRVIITDKLRSYGAALRKLGLVVDHRAHKGLNNRIEGSHRPTRKREKIQGRFKSARQAQGFLTIHDETANLFRPRRHKMTATTYRQKRADAFRQWEDDVDRQFLSLRQQLDDPTKIAYTSRRAMPSAPPSCSSTTASARPAPGAFSQNALICREGRTWTKEIMVELWHGAAPPSVHR